MTRETRNLLWLLVPSALFASYDGQLRALLLHQIQSNFHASLASLGLINIPIQAGQFLGFFVVRFSDKIGRRPILIWSIAFYTASSLLTAISWDLWSYALFQCLSQVAIGSEFGVAVTLLSESVPDESRGKYLSRLLMIAPLGAILAGSILTMGGLGTPIGWRLFYLIALPPLVLVTVLRTKISESPLFASIEDAEEVQIFQSHQTLSQSTKELWENTPHRRSVVSIGLISLLQELALTATIGWWSIYAESERQISTATTGILFALAALSAIPGYLFCGTAMERWGRKFTTIVYLSLSLGSGLILFLSHSFSMIVPALILSSFFGLGIAPVLAALTAESFPTHLRASASAWIRNGFANVGSMIGPAAVGLIAPLLHLSIGGAISVLLIVATPSIFLVILSVRETRGVRLQSD